MYNVLVFCVLLGFFGEHFSFPCSILFIVWKKIREFKLRSPGVCVGSGGTQKKEQEKRIMYNFLDSFLSEVFHNDVIASALLR